MLIPSAAFYQPRQISGPIFCAQSELILVLKWYCNIDAIALQPIEYTEGCNGEGVWA